MALASKRSLGSTLPRAALEHFPASVETPYRREPGYPERYRDRRFRSGSGARTHAREVALLRQLLALAPCGAGPWLDLPCGAGRLSDLLPQPVVRADRDATMLSAAGPTLPRACAAAAALPFRAGAFAGALCHRLLHHLPTPQERVAILRELRRVTRGPLLVSFFDAHSLQHWRRRLRVWRRPSRRNALTRRAFARELLAAGWQPVVMRGLGRWFSEQCLVLALPPNDRSPAACASSAASPAGGSPGSPPVP